MRFALLFIGLFLSAELFAQSVGIGTSTPKGSAILDVADTTKGILIPRMTQAQRLGIQSPDNGLMVYQTDNSSGLWIYDGVAWAPFMKLPSGGSAGKVLTYCNQGLTWTTNGVCPGAITSLNCSEAVIPVILAGSTIPTNIFEIPYTGGDGVVVSIRSFLSTGVTGLAITIGPPDLLEQGTWQMAMEIFMHASLVLPVDRV